MTQIDAFTLLEQFAKFTKLGAQMQSERDGWRKNAGVLRGRKQKDAADGVVKDRAGGGMHVPRMAWTGTGTATT